MLDKREKKVIDGPDLVIEQDSKFREMKRSGDIDISKVQEEPCPCKWPDN